jgi:hypothetical protein
MKGRLPKRNLSASKHGLVYRLQAAESLSVSVFRTRTPISRWALAPIHRTTGANALRLISPNHCDDHLPLQFYTCHCNSKRDGLLKLLLQQVLHQVSILFSEHIIIEVTLGDIDTFASEAQIGSLLDQQPNTFG